MPEDFFKFRQRVSRKSKKVEKAPAETASSGAMSVSQLTALIDGAIKAGIPASVLVRGEVSNLNVHRASGHIYFTLKDSNACIDCVVFRSDAARLKFTPADGIDLLARGRVSIYPQRGRYQLYVTSLLPVGQGALELALQQLRSKLEMEGLFLPERKKPLPLYPRRIAIVTSQSTAALQDMLKVLRRFPYLKLMLFHVQVQGDGAARQIADALRLIDQHKRAEVDVILLGRGGGSLEDLWAFNEEVVARAIAASHVPVVTGIGHEVDVSIADLVADYHAHTPTEAARVVTANWRDADVLLEDGSLRLVRALRQRLTEAKTVLESIARLPVFRRPADRLQNLRQFLDEKQQALAVRLAGRLRRETANVSRLALRLGDRHPRQLVRLLRQRVDALETHLHAVSPMQVLKRGYSITTRRRDGAVVRSAAELRAGDRIVTQFADGIAGSVVEDHRQLPLFPDRE